MIHILNSFRNYCLAVFLIFSILLYTGCREPDAVNPEPNPVVLITADDSEEEILRKANQVRPGKRQLEWQKKEFLAFIHFNLFTQNPEGEYFTMETFNPEEFDAGQWVEVCKNLGMKMVILTAKHHRGFCLWPSEYTEYSVKNSPWRDGKGDVVKELSDACKDAGLELGIYISPWDMHEPTYGTPAYDEYFKNQLRELLTNYGPVAEVWFDGHYGGPEGGRQDYKWTEYYELIRELQPEAVIAIRGPDARWVGNESGYSRESEWSVLPVKPVNDVPINESKNYDLIDLFPYQINDRAEDLGSRKKINDTEKPFFLVWYPAETDVSFRPSWNYKPEEEPHSLKKLLDIYYESIGRNSVLLLNFTPDWRGLIPEADVKRAAEFREVLDATFDENLVQNANAKATDSRRGYKAGALYDDDDESYWTTPEDIQQAAIEFDLGEEKTFNRVLLQEYIRNGQKIEEFFLESWDGEKWKKFAEGTTVGYKRILRFDDLTTDKVRLRITGSRAAPELNNFGLYFQPPVEE
ncbi:MAG: alpha-L-fucosidase [bacterium]